MKKHQNLLVAAFITAAVLTLSAALPILSKPAFVVYVICTAGVTVAYDYTRGRVGHRHL